MRGRLVIAVTGAAVLALAPAAASAPSRGYRGASHGVSFALIPVASGGAALTVTFGPGSGVIRARALRTRDLEVFCVWPPVVRSSFFAGTIVLNPGRRTARLELKGIPDTTGFLCGLHAPVPSVRAGGASYLRKPIVVARLTRVHG